MSHKIISILCLLLLTAPLRGQQSKIYDADLRTLRMTVNGKSCDFPVITLGKGESFELSFDDLRHDYRRFTYRLEHVAADFQTDEGLFDNEYMVADDSELPLEGYTQSMNTSILYNHYSLSIPNADMRPLISGNYRLIINGEDEDGEPMRALEVYFGVTEQLAPITLSATTDTEIDRNDAHQQLTLTVDCSNLGVRDAATDVKIVVRQNGRYDNAAVDPRPTGQMGQVLKWEHSRELIFKAGNEFRKFEQTSTRYPGMHVDRVRYKDPYYFALLMPDAPRRNYLYDEDQNGAFVPRSDRNGDPDTEADYMWMLFSLEMPPLPDHDVYVDGIWTAHDFTPALKMDYEPEDGAYELPLLLKQGYYSYQYLAVPKNGGPAETRPIEGDFYQTENRYDVFVYCRKPGERYDRLVGWRQGSFSIRHK